MKRPFLNLLIAILLGPAAVSLSAAPDFVEITAENMARESAETPVVAIFSMSCDIGSYAVNMHRNSLADVRGVRAGAVDLDHINSISRPIYELYEEHGVETGERGLALGTLLLIYRGKVLHTSQMDFPGKSAASHAGGLNGERRWLEYALKEHGLKFSTPYALPTSDRARPLRDASRQVNLKSGLLAHYKFEGNRKDSTGQQRDIRTIGRFAVRNGALFGDGVYDSSYSDAFFTYSRASDEPYAREFTIGLSFRPASLGYDRTDKGLATVAVLGYHILLVGIQEKRLVIQSSPTYQLGEKGDLGSWYYMLDDASVQRDRWHTLVLRGDIAAGRLGVFWNGKRLKDIVLGRRMLEKIAAYKPGANFQVGPSLGMGFSQRSRGHIYHGLVDNIVVYNRALNSAEMRALHEQIDRGDHSVTESDEQSEADEAQRARESRKLQLAAYAGQLSKARQAIRAGANVNAAYSGWTPLMYAAYFGHTGIVRLLIKNHADVLLKKDGWDAQRLARSQGHAGIVQLLEDYSVTERFYFRRGFPLVPETVKSRSVPTLTPARPR